ncbi:Mov34/MPN/PAD-1 family protein [Mesorhizobium sp. M0013]|uniref:Mov34/MPN/PAD-1 family protein n=1 Tax=Mesorhizobium sp. M0013 TaxID=2956841 RepID=UPI00333DB9C4
MKYLAASGTQELILAPSVLDHFAAHRQVGRLDREAGGQLFASFEGQRIVVEVATGPRSIDRRSRFSFIPNKWADRAEIRRLHRQGLHYLGDWHTHPESVPTPSPVDRASMHDMFAKSRHDLAGFLMIIVGTELPPAGLFVAIFQAESWAPLSPVTE